MSRSTSAGQQHHSHSNHQHHHRLHPSSGVTNTSNSAAASSTAVAGNISARGDYPEPHVVFEFFTDNPQKLMPVEIDMLQQQQQQRSHDSPSSTCGGGSSKNKETSSTPTGANVFYDPYWEAIRYMQQSDDFMEGMLLRSVDCNPRYPFIHYIIYRNCSTQPSSNGAHNSTTRSSNPVTNSGNANGGSNGGCVNDSFDGGDVRMTSSSGGTLRQEQQYAQSSVANRNNIDLVEVIKTQGGYRELHTFVNEHVPLLPKRPSNPNTAYIVSAFMTSSGGNLDNLDRTWSYWSGADYIVENIPASLKLERITFHKILNVTDHPSSSSSGGGGGSGPLPPPSGSYVAPAASSPPMTTTATTSLDRKSFSYVLLCELSEALADLNRAREFIDHLKFRQCGVSSLYVIDHFF